MSSELPIGPNTRVFLNFSITLETGEEVDSNFDRSPVDFVMGDGSLLPGFEACLVDLKGGDSAIFEIAPEDGFGEPHPDNFQEVRRSDFAGDADLTAGMVFSFADAAGGEVPGVIDSFDDETVRVNFNHPLAGRTLTFHVKIDRVEPAEVH
jgi:FKBP-type peptidyl-prolyl cis-trans isomerase SlpA